MNNLDGSISLIEKTSKKLLPIYRALLNKISNIENKKDWINKHKDQDDRSKSALFEMESSDDSRNNEDEEDDATRAKNGK